jgi:hypothetical protein
VILVAGRRARGPQGEEEVRRHRGAAFFEGEDHSFLQGRCEFFIGLYIILKNTVFVKLVPVAVPCLKIPSNFIPAILVVSPILYFDCVG